jgi:hypothetical protein
MFWSRQCVEAAAKGCLALVNRQPAWGRDAVPTIMISNGNSEQDAAHLSMDVEGAALPRMALLDQNCALDMMSKFALSVQVRCLHIVHNEKISNV